MSSLRTVVLVMLLGLGVYHGLGASAGTPPPLSSPIAFFRQLLESDTEQRQQLLGNHSPVQRQLIQAKLGEYEALPAVEREQRLHATEFRYFLRPLLTASATNRPAQLAVIPEQYRQPIGDRLARWDALPSVARSNLLTYDHALTLLARFQLSSRTTTTPPPPFPQPKNARLEAELARWRALPESQRDELCQRFEEFFDLSNPDQERALAELSADERREMENTLQAFARLPAVQRRLCISSFRRFAQLSTADRLEFLRSADRWREMSAAERSEWRQLVNRLPPLPPGFDSPPPLPPPLPRVSLAATPEVP